MPRRSSGGRSSSSSSFSRRPAMRNPTEPAASAPPPARAQKTRGGLGAAVADGIGWGVGTAIAHRAVDAVLGPRVIHHETVAAPASAPAAEPAPGSGSMSSDACSVHSKAFQDCINSNGEDISNCQFYLNMLNECRRAGETIQA